MSDQYEQILSRLGKAKRVLITTHVRPDGDALGSVAAMVLAMRVKQIDCEVLLLSHLPTKYRFVFDENNIDHHDAEKGWPVGLEMDRFDTFLVVDTGTWSQLPGMKERIEKFTGTKLVVDHHLTQENWADVKLVVKDAAAAGEIVAELLELWDVKIDAAIATALYLAISTDTGWFQFSNTRPFTMRLAANLMEAGVDTDRMYKLLYQNERAQRIALQSRAMNSLELLSDNRLAVMCVSRADFTAAGASVTDTENLINIPLAIKTVEASILITETPEPGPIRVSLRSKGQIDVAKLAETFGGGGHARAAGLKVEGSMQDVHRKVVDAFVKKLSQL